MKLIEDQTRVNGRDCIKFVPRTTQATFLRIYNGQGCWSYVNFLKLELILNLISLKIFKI